MRGRDVLFSAVFPGLVLLISGLSISTESVPIAGRATISFRDGSTLVISNPIFVYRWSSRLQAANWKETVSCDFHYCEKVHGVELGQTISGKEIRSLELFYPKTARGDRRYFAPEKIEITQFNGVVTTVPKNNLVASPEFLLGKTSEEVEDTVYFQALEIRGVAEIGGKSGLFRGRLSAEQGPFLEESETVTNILFHEGE